MDANTTQNQKGFTLVEIAIVLVIIGLLLGGVLKGQELITNSKIKSLTKDLEGIVAASYAYQDRTGRLAGDATGSPAVTDGIINASQFWGDLRDEGFLSGVTGVAPSALRGPSHGLNGIFSAHPALAANMFGTKNFICAENVEESIAQGIDIKLDDGVPDAGEIRVGESITTPRSSYVAANAEKGVLLCKAL